ncbi:MAG: glycosyltransferase family 87 protein [Candidatus Dormibacteraceae bacterium]
MTKDRRAWVWLGLVVVVAALALDILHRQDRTGVDFHTYLAAARVGLWHGWAHLYDQRMVAQEQKTLVPYQLSQPFLSPPTVAWLAAGLTGLPYQAAYVVWALLTFTALAGALAWASVSQGVSRWVAVVGALAPWWVMHAVNVGQVVPLVAASAVVSWRLLRDRRDVAAGLVLSAVLLKPNTASLVPFVLLIIGRRRAFLAWLGAAAAIVVVAGWLLGAHGLSPYVAQLTSPLPIGADALTLHSVLGVNGLALMLVRAVIVVAVFAGAYRLRAEVGLAIPLAIVGSLVIAPYLHGSDLCLLAAAAWMVWEARPAASWRVPLAAAWVVATPFFFNRGLTPTLNRWPWFELALLLALMVSAWRPLTAEADLRTRAPA